MRRLSTRAGQLADSAQPRREPSGGCAGVGAARKPKRERAYAPRLTASSYKYFVRGMNVKATENDVVVQARRRATLKPYDKLLKAFRCASRHSGGCSKVGLAALTSGDAVQQAELLLECWVQM